MCPRQSDHSHCCGTRVVVTSLEFLTCDGERLEKLTASVEMQDQPTGPCPAFRATFGWCPGASGPATPKGQRDSLLLSMHLRHGPAVEEVRLHMQTKSYTEARARKARTGKRLRVASCRYDGARPRDVRWGFEEDKGT